jgi:hypothetical protein
VDHDVPAVNPLDRNDLKRDSVGVGAKEEDQIVASRTWIERTNAVLHDVPGSLVRDPVFRGRSPEDDNHLMP